jgi:hypothetical protein
MQPLWSVFSVWWRANVWGSHTCWNHHDVIFNMSGNGFRTLMGGIPIPPIRVNGNSQGLWWVTWEFHPSNSRMASLELEVVSSITYFLDWSCRINRKENLLPDVTR